MKRVLVFVVALLFASDALADTCAKSLMPTFTSYQAAKLCGTYGAGYIGTQANNTFVAARNAANGANINIWKLDSSDNTLINSSASDELIFQLEDDASRLISFTAASDAALAMKFGDAGTTATQIFTLSGSTADADDDSSIRIAGGGAFGTDGTRGATIVVPGEEVSGGSDITYNAGASDTHIFQVAGTTEVTISNDALTFTGAAATIIPGATSLAFRDTANARNNLLISDAGEVTAAGASLGWSYVTGANTACTTTCTFAAVFGVDLAAGASAPVIVGPASASADACVCAGAN